MSDISLSKAVRTNLLSLQNTASMMNKTQERLATGNKVNSALDNPTNFFTASALNSRASDMSNLLDSMASGIKTIEAANNGITAITKTVESMQSTLRQARQDKSFQTQTYEVTEASVLSINGGQYTGSTNISLQTQSPGSAATVGSVNTYAGVTPDDAVAGEGIGARSVISLDPAVAFNDVIKVAGKDVTLTTGTGAPTAADIATDIQAALDGDVALTGKYKASAGTGANTGKVVVETVDPAAAAATVSFGTGVTAATKGVTTIKYDATTVGNVKVGTENISTGTTFDEFVAGLKAKEKDGDYTVTSDALTKTVQLTSNAWGTAAPVVSGVANTTAAGSPTAATSTFNVALGSAAAFTVAGQAVSLTASSPLVPATAPTTQVASFSVDNTTGGTFDIGGQTVTIGASDSDATMQGNINTALAAGPSGYTANVTGGVVTLTAGTTGTSTNPAITANGGSVAGTMTTTTLGTPLNAGSPAVAGDDATTAKTKIDAALTTAGLNTTFTATVSALGAVAITANTPGVATAPAIAGPGATTSVMTNGLATSVAVNGQSGVPGAAGASTATVAAATDDVTVTYGDKSAELKITGMVQANATATTVEVAKYQSDTIKSVNDQLKAQGLDTLQASFSADGKLSITSKSTEAKTLAVSGTNANAIFGATTVNTGKASVSGYNSTGTVDKFVEEINKSQAGKLRASNDNGKLRIENLSTEELSVSHDADGAGVGSPISSTIAGNSVRENLSKQFNDLRDQLDKLSDDASFNGINLLRGDELTLTFNENGSSTIKIQNKDANGNATATTAQNLNVTSLVGEDLDTDASIDKLLAKLSTSLNTLRSQASTFGSNLSSVQNRQDFTKNMVNTLQTGAANLTLADTNEEAANLLALQTRQQLSSSALSMASQQDQAVLRLLQ